MSVGGARVLVVGLGGIGCPAAAILARAGAALHLVDDDVVDVTNLQRQILFEPGDVGRAKVEVGRERLLALGATRVDASRERLRPDSAMRLVDGHALVVEGADNYATKFLAFDAARASRVPIVSAGAVRWGGWTMASFPERGPCLRCVFEDVPEGEAATCAEAGVVGPVVGVVGSLAASLALRVLSGDSSARGRLFRYDGLHGRVRRSMPLEREDCPSCSGRIEGLSPDGYAPKCADSN
jgi:molybdopterin-synthase adenylyltransferase